MSCCIRDSDIPVTCVAAYLCQGRKHFIKKLKSHITKIAVDEFAHRVLMKLFSVVDDTGLVQKVILSVCDRSIIGG